MIGVVLVVIGLAMSFVVYPVLLMEAKKGTNDKLTVLATATNLAGIIIIVVTLVLVLIMYLL